MALIKIKVRDNLKTEIEEAFAALYANPDALAADDLVIHYLSVYIRNVVNEYREKQALETAKAGVVKEEKIDV